MKTEAETGGMRPQAQGHLEPPEAGRSRNDPPLSLWRGHGPAASLISDFQSPELGENEFLLFKLPSLRSSVAAAPGDGYRLQWKEGSFPSGPNKGPRDGPRGLAQAPCPPYFNFFGPEIRFSHGKGRSPPWTQWAESTLALALAHALSRTGRGPAHLKHGSEGPSCRRLLFSLLPVSCSVTFDAARGSHRWG